MKKRYPSLAVYLEKVETQMSLAARLGVAQSAISSAKHGRGSYRLLKRIAQATGVPLESFDRKDAA